MSNLYFRLAQPDDLEAVTTVYLDAIKEMKRNGIEQWDEIYPNRQTLEKDISLQQLTLGFLEDKIACAYVLNHEYDDEYAFGAWEGYEASFLIIHRICVNPAFQNKGIGSRTIRHIEEQVREQGIDSIRLDAFSQNPYALLMYTKLGYKTAGIAHLRKGAFLLMEKILTEKKQIRPGKLIGQGNTADVYDWTKGKVVKLFVYGYPYEAVRKEYSNSIAINPMNFLKPNAYALVTIDDRIGIIYDLIEGESLLDYCIRTKDLELCSDILSALHKTILEQHCSKLPDYKDFLTYHSMRAAHAIGLSDTETKQEVIDKISQLPDSDTLCHGDFHPGNIILVNDSQGSKIYIIDFMNLCHGPALYDIARTVYLIQYTPVPPNTEEPEAMLLFKTTLADLYLEKMAVSRSSISEYLSLIALVRKDECHEENL